MFASTGQEQVYTAALEQLEKLQHEMNYEKVTAKQQQRRRHAILMSGMLLVSMMSVTATQLMMPPLNRPLSAAESEALVSLIGYVAMKKGSETGWVRQIMLAHLEATHFDELQADDYDEAVSYLLKLAS